MNNMTVGKLIDCPHEQSKPLVRKLRMRIIYP